MCVLVFSENILVYKDLETFVYPLKVLPVLTANDLKVNRKKCTSGQPKLELGIFYETFSYKL